MKQSNIAFIFATMSVLLPSLQAAQGVAADKDGNARHNEEQLSFQTGGQWSPRTNLNADVVMIYGIDPSLLSKINSWLYLQFEDGIWNAK